MLKSNMQAKAVHAFRRRFKGEPTVVARAPVRVNLMGDHTVYNQGFVLPMAIDRSVWIAARPVSEHHMEVVETCRSVSGIDIGIQETSRRAGDAAVLAASSKRARAGPLGLATNKCLGMLE